MTIDLPITWTSPGIPQNGTVTVTFEEVKLPEGYHTRVINEKLTVWPVGFPEEQKDAFLKPIYHKLNFERQKVVIDDAVIEQ